MDDSIVQIAVASVKTGKRTRVNILPDEGLEVMGFHMAIAKSDVDRLDGRAKNVAIGTIRGGLVYRLNSPGINL